MMKPWRLVVLLFVLGASGLLQLTAAEDAGKTTSSGSGHDRRGRVGKTKADTQHGATMDTGLHGEASDQIRLRVIGSR